MTKRANDPRRPSLAFLGFIMSEQAEALVRRVDPAPAIQSHRFGLSLATLLRRVVPDLNSYNFVPVQDFPIARKLVFRGEDFRRDGRLHRALPFVNALGLKHLTRFFALLAAIGNLRRHDLLVVHGLHLPNLLFAVLLRRLGVKIGVVLTDEQGIVLPSDNRLRRSLKRLDRRMTTFLSRGFDFSVALSPDLAAIYTPNLPTLILPGVYSDELERKARADRSAPEPNRRSGFRVVYFGLLSAEYGVQAMLDAAALLPPEAQLRFFGRGPLEQALAAAAQRDERVHYGGIVDQDRLVLEMRQADLLMNARPAEGRLARMSSPSKLLEYAASGTLVATTRLPTIPSDLLDACIVIEDASGPGVAAAIERAMATARDERAAMGDAFRQRVRSRYSADVLARDIGTLFSKVTHRSVPGTHVVDAHPVAE